MKPVFQRIVVSPSVSRGPKVTPIRDASVMLPGSKRHLRLAGVGLGRAIPFSEALLLCVFGSLLCMQRWERARDVCRFLHRSSPRPAGHSWLPRALFSTPLARNCVSVNCLLLCSHRALSRRMPAGQSEKAEDTRPRPPDRGALSAAPRPLVPPGGFSLAF